MPRDGVEHPSRRCRANPWDQQQHAETCDPVARVLGETQQRKHILHMGEVEELQPAELHERHIAAGEFHLKLAGMAGGAEEDRLLHQPLARLAVLQNLIDDMARLIGFVLHRHEARLLR